MDNSAILWLELVVGVITSFTLLGLLIWGIKGGQFDDSKKLTDGLLNDSVEELQDAIKKEEKIKKLKERLQKEEFYNPVTQKKEKYECFNGTADIYIYFFE